MNNLKILRNTIQRIDRELMTVNEFVPPVFFWYKVMLFIKENSASYK